MFINGWAGSGMVIGRAYRSYCWPAKISLSHPSPYPIPLLSHPFPSLSLPYPRGPLAFEKDRVNEAFLSAGRLAGCSEMAVLVIEPTPSRWTSRDSRQPPAAAAADSLAFLFGVCLCQRLEARRQPTDCSRKPSVH